MERLDDTSVISCIYKDIEEESGVFGSTSDILSITDYATGNHADKSIFLEEEVGRLKKQVEVMKVEK